MKIHDYKKRKPEPKYSILTKAILYSIAVGMILSASVQKIAEPNHFVSPIPAAQAIYQPCGGTQ